MYIRPSASELRTQAAYVPSGLNYTPAGRDEETHHHDDGKPHCKFAGCTKGPSYGYEQPGGGGTGMYCATHKRPGMTFIRHAANEPAAAKNPTVLEHVPRGMIHVPNTSQENIVHHEHVDDTKEHCKHPGCTKAPSYAFPGKSEGEYCYSHKSQSMTQCKKVNRTVTHGHIKGMETHPNLGNDEKKHETKPPSTESTQQQEPVATPTSEDSLRISHEPDLAEGLRCIAIVKANGEDPITGFKYLINIAAHAEDAKYRTIKRHNAKFNSEVWLNPGMRGLFKAIGWHESRGEDGQPTVVLEPTDNTLDVLIPLLRELIISTGKVQLLGQLQDVEKLHNASKHVAAAPAHGFVETA